MVSGIHDNANLVLGVQTFLSWKEKMSERELSFKLLNQTVPIFPVHKEMLNSKEIRYVMNNPLSWMKYQD